MNNKKTKSSFKLSQFLLLPLLLGLILVGLTVFWLEDAWLKAGIIIIASALVGFRLEWQRFRTEPANTVAAGVTQNIEPASSEQWMHDLSEVIIKVIEVSNRQIENSRIQTEEAITQMSSRFTSLVTRLNSALEAATLSNAAVPASDGSASTLLDNVFTNSRAQLSGDYH